MNIFNPEHDLCLANGDPNFVPPASALEFGHDCSGIVDWICRPSGDRIAPWGWDAVLKRRLQKTGVPEEMLPSDTFISKVRDMSRRSVALRADAYVHDAVRCSCPSLQHCLQEPGSVLEFHDVEDVVAAVDVFGDAVLKMPLSGSGKGLRWARVGEMSPNDVGWCRNVISRQGSVMVEKRRDLVRNFAMLFRVQGNDVRFEGYSMFFCDNGIYKGNVLAGDGAILSVLSRHVPEALVLMVKEALTMFIMAEFGGWYDGFLGADMFIYRDGGGFRMAPCVELNVRMTMGLLARRVYDRHLDGLLKTWNPGEEDGRYVMNVEYSPSAGELCSRLDGVAATLTAVTPESRYAVWIVDSDRVL